MEKTHPYFSILNKLTKAGIRYSVVGLMGASFYGSDQTTYDLDVCVEPDEKKLTKLRTLFQKLGLTEIPVLKEKIIKPSPSSKEILEKKMTLLFADPYGLSIDVLPCISGVNFKDLWGKKKTFTLSGDKIYVASLEHIIASKTKADRPKDRLHVKRLKDLLKNQ